MKTILLFVVILIASPLLTFAQTRLVTCAGDACKACDLVTLVNTLINFVIYLGSFVAVILFMYAGFTFVTAAGNMGKISKAKGIFKDVLIGLIIMLTGFLVVDTVMQMLVGPDLLGGGKWNEIKCVANSTVQQGPGWTASSTQGGVLVTTTPGAGGTVPTGGTTRYSCRPEDGQTSCVPVSASAIASQSCPGGVGNRVINPEYAEKLAGVGSGWCASSIGIEPGHGSGCHLRGNCIDAVCTGASRTCSPEQALVLQNSFRQAGQVTVFEVTSAADVPRYRNAGVCVYYEPRATGAHFSVYNSRWEPDGQLKLAGGAQGNCQ